MVGGRGRGGGGRGKEPQAYSALSTELDVGLHPSTLRSHPSRNQESDAKTTEPPVSLGIQFFKDLGIAGFDSRPLGK